MNTFLDARIHSATNFYSHIQNMRQMENLKLQLKRKEEDLALLLQLHEVYQRSGYMSMLEVSQERIARTTVDIFLLELDLNRLKEQLHDFVSAALLED